MRKEELLEILYDWNFWKKELDIGKERFSYIERCMRLLRVNVVTSVIGVRRSGKSYIMRQMVKRLNEKGIKSKNILMVNFEDKRFVQFYPKLLDEVYTSYIEFLQPDKEQFIFLDEIHNVPKWERWVRTMHELGKAKIIISGSSSNLLRNELATVLTGRHLDIFVFSLSFKEFLYFKNLEIKNELELIANKIEIKRAFNEYIEFGGFPEVVLSNEKKQLLLTYFDDILTKDIEKRYKLRENEKLRALARFYLTNISNTITFNSMKKFLETTTNTIEKFSSYLEEVNMLFFVKRFSFKVKEQEKAARKVYAVDVGLSNTIGFKFSSNIGKIVENIVAIELKKEQKSGNIEIYYWQDAMKREVDFIIKKGQKIHQLVQVCWNIDEYKTKEREIKALLKAGKELKCRNLLVITEEYEGEEKIGNKKIRHVPLWRYLISII